MEGNGTKRSFQCFQVDCPSPLGAPWVEIMLNIISMRYSPLISRIIPKDSSSSLRLNLTQVPFLPDTLAVNGQGVWANVWMHFCLPFWLLFWVRIWVRFLEGSGHFVASMISVFLALWRRTIMRPNLPSIFVSNLIWKWVSTCKSVWWNWPAFVSNKK